MKKYNVNIFEIGVIVLTILMIKNKRLSHFSNCPRTFFVKQNRIVSLTCMNKHFVLQSRCSTEVFQLVHCYHENNSAGEQKKITTEAPIAVIQRKSIFCLFLNSWKCSIFLRNLERKIPCIGMVGARKTLK